MNFIHGLESGVRLGHTQFRQFFRMMRSNLFASIVVVWEPFDPLCFKLSDNLFRIAVPVHMRYAY